MSENIKPLPATHNGLQLRSWTEKRVCVALDAMDIRYTYEPEGFKLQHGNFYRPDFYLPVWDVWIEVKHEGWMNDPAEVLEIDQKAKDLCMGTGRAVLVTDGALRSEWQGRCWFLSCKSTGMNIDAPGFVVPNEKVELASSRFLFTGEPRASRGSGIRIELESVLGNPRIVPLKRSSNGAYRRHDLPFLDLCGKDTLQLGASPAFVKAAVGDAVRTGMACRYEIGGQQDPRPPKPKVGTSAKEVLDSILATLKDLGNGLYRGDLSVEQIGLILTRCNGRNRPIRKAELEKLKRDMLDETGPGYRDKVGNVFHFLADGNLANGQHRLIVANELGKLLCDCKIITGCTEDDLQAFDTGVLRGEVDYMTTMYGRPVDNRAPSVAKGYLLYFEDRYTSERLAKKYPDLQKLSRCQNDNYSAICEIVKLARTANRSAGGVAPVWGGLTLVAYKHDSPERALSFLRGCAYDEDGGEALPMDDPRRQLRKFAISQKGKPPKGWAVDLAKAYVCCYEAFRSGARMKKMRSLGTLGVEFAFAPKNGSAPADEGRQKTKPNPRHRPQRRNAPRPLLIAGKASAVASIAPGPEVFDVTRTGDAEIKTQHTGQNGEDAILMTIHCEGEKAGRIHVLQVLDFDGAYRSVWMVERTRSIWSAWAKTEIPKSKAEAVARIGELTVPERLQCVYNDRKMWDLVVA